MRVRFQFRGSLLTPPVLEREEEAVLREYCERDAMKTVQLMNRLPPEPATIEITARVLAIGDQ